jgi:hypothetical protein
MTRTNLIAVVFAALLVTVGTAAAAPGNAPVGVGGDDRPAQANNTAANESASDTDDATGGDGESAGNDGDDAADA